MALSLDGTTGISASGNIVGNNISVSGTLTAGTFSPSSLSASGNITGGNLVTAGLITATGNITGGNLLLSGNIFDSGTSLIINTTTSANIALAPNQSNVVIATTTGANITGTLNATGNIDGGNLRTAGLITATGNIQGGNLLTGGLISATGNITGGNVLGGANVNATTHTGTTVSVTGNITGGNLSVSTGTVSVGNIVNTNANGVGNIGSASLYYNTVFAKATSAQYADVAEKYVADRVYAPGTVLEIGGPAEVQETTSYASTRIAGVVSTTPALLMNSGESDQNAVELALLGRVPCRVTGTVHRGDLLTSSDRPGVATALKNGDYQPGCVIGKALAAHATAGEGTIEIIVGRL